MVKCNSISRSLIKIRAIILLVALLSIMPFCNKEQSTDNSVYFQSDKLVGKKWNGLFTDEVLISFTKDNKPFEFIFVSAITTNSMGEYIIVDGKLRKVMRFNKEGEYIGTIGAQGEGPGEYYIASCPYINENGDLYLFDFGKMRIIKYVPPHYNAESQINIGHPIQDLIVNNKGQFILYSTNQQAVLSKHDLNGKLIKKGFSPPDEFLRIFIARFQLGRMCHIPDKKMILFSYPDNYQFELFDFDLNKKKTLKSKVESKFFPPPVKFPKSLSPYSFTPDHSEWWCKNLRVADIHYLNNEVFISVLFEYNNLSAKSYINIHDLDGTTFAAGLEVPNNGIIRYAKDGYIYVVENSSFDEEGDIIPIKIRRYKLKLNLEGRKD